MSALEDIEAFAAEHLDDATAENMSVWIALRAGRQASLMGATREARLRRGPEWISEPERARLLAWLHRRRAAGKSHRPPPAPSRPPRFPG